MISEEDKVTQLQLKLRLHREWSRIKRQRQKLRQKLLVKFWNVVKLSNLSVTWWCCLCIDFGRTSNTQSDQDRKQ